jgi:pimeloyl-ACP methyl ester carboxylesterase
MRRFLITVLIAGCAWASVLPGLPEEVTIGEWIVCGPFSVGPREGITGVVEDAASFRPAEGDSFRSSLVQGGVVTCRKQSVDSLGWLETGYRDVRWDTIQQYHGIAALISAGYAYAQFECPRACRAKAKAEKLGGFVLNGRSYLGDVYGNGWFETPVELDSGTNHVLLRISGFGDRRVRFRLMPVTDPVEIVARDVTAPDLVPDSGQTAWFGIPLVNNTSACLKEVRLQLRLLDDSVIADTLVRNLVGFGARKAAVLAHLPPMAYDSAGLSLVVRAELTNTSSTFDLPKREVASETLRLPFRKPHQPRRQTFLSGIDNSCQYYAVTYPEDFDPARRYPVIFTLHGAGVEAWGQANAYRQKDWAFVVAPTNRRPYGFDWQDWGRLDALEVLDTVLSRLPIDPDRVLLCGGSMGGHGDWHVGLNHPDRFAVVAPQASWPTHQLYVPWFLQRSVIFAQPGQLAIRDKALRSDNVPALLSNALNLPYFVVHGGDDDNVPTLHGRNFSIWLDELGQEFRYREVPNRGHWWSDESLGITVADDTALMDYIRDRRRVSGPSHVRFRSGDLGTSYGAYWVSIEQAKTVGEDAAIEAWADDSTVRVSTENVARFRLHLDGRPFSQTRVKVEVDGQHVAQRLELPSHPAFHRSKDRWQMGEARLREPHKTPARYGPAKQAMMRPFVLVYGTGDSFATDFLRHTATQEALRWWLIANGSTEVLPDSEVTDFVIASRNLVLFGGPAENSVSRRIAHALPVHTRDGHMFVAEEDMGDSLAAMVVFPNPLNPERLTLVRMGTDPEHTRLASFWGLVSSGAGVPDFLVFDRQVRRYGWAGVRAAGFFGPDWGVDPASTYVRK